MKKFVVARRFALFIGAFLMALSALPLLAAHPAAAQDAQESITLSPVKNIYSVDPGQTLSDSLTVLNDGQTAYDFVVYATPYSVQDSSYAPNFVAEKPNADAYTWVQFEKTTYHAEPRETVTVPYTLNVKKDAAPGGHYGAIFVEILPEKSEGKTGVIVHKRISSIIYASVNGTAELAGQTNGITIPWFQSHPPLTATTSVENTGNTDFPATVTLSVKNLFGTAKHATTQEYTVLPGTTRDIKVTWEGANWFGLYHTTVTTKALDKTTTESSYVLMMPLWLILLLIVFSVAGGVYAYYAQQKKQKKSPTKTKKKPTKEDSAS